MTVQKHAHRRRASGVLMLLVLSISSTPFAQSRPTTPAGKDLVKVVERRQIEAHKSWEHSHRDVLAAQELASKIARKHLGDEAQLIWREKVALERVRETYSMEEALLQDFLRQASYGIPDGEYATLRAQQMNRFSEELGRAENETFALLETMRSQHTPMALVALVNRELGAHQRARVALEEHLLSLDLVLKGLGKRGVQELLAQQREAVERSAAYYRMRSAEAEINRQMGGAVVIASLLALNAARIVANELRPASPTEVAAAKHKISEANAMWRQVCRLLGRTFHEPKNDELDTGWCRP